LLKPLLVIACLGGCDVVWGLSGEPSACELGAFDGEPVATATDGFRFTVSGDGERAILIEDEASVFEAELAIGDRQPVELPPYTPIAIALSPEGDLLFHSSAIEPTLLELAERTNGVWMKSDRVPPKGVFAGVPSSLAFGARRVIVRLRDTGTDVQEYVDDGAAWNPVGDPQPLPGSLAGNLTENGLTMTFLDVDPANGEPAIFAANRASVDDWFGAPVQLRAGTHETNGGQLIGKTTCDTLFVSEQGALRRFDR
jgi:hypothetical protein